MARNLPSRPRARSRGSRAELLAHPAGAVPRPPPSPAPWAGDRREQVSFQTSAAAAEIADSPPQRRRDTTAPQQEECDREKEGQKYLARRGAACVRRRAAAGTPGTGNDAPDARAAGGAGGGRSRRSGGRGSRRRRRRPEHTLARSALTEVVRRTALFGATHAVGAEQVLLALLSPRARGPLTSRRDPRSHPLGDTTGAVQRAGETRSTVLPAADSLHEVADARDTVGILRAGLTEGTARRAYAFAPRDVAEPLGTSIIAAETIDAPVETALLINLARAPVRQLRGADSPRARYVAARSLGAACCNAAGIVRAEA